MKIADLFWSEEQQAKTDAYWAAIRQRDEEERAAATSDPHRVRKNLLGLAVILTLGGAATLICSGLLGIGGSTTELVVGVVTMVAFAGVQRAGLYSPYWRKARRHSTHA